jgi:hypothetical protein
MTESRQLSAGSACSAATVDAAAVRDPVEDVTAHSCCVVAHAMVAAGNGTWPRAAPSLVLAISADVASHAIMRPALVPTTNAFPSGSAQNPAVGSLGIPCTLWSTTALDSSMT